MTQINPPFDGSAPCPMCSQEVRGVSALVHNFLVRWPEGKAFVKLNDLRHYGRWDEANVIEHPAVRELLDVVKLLREACDGMTEEGLTVRWTPEIREKVAALVPRAEAAECAVSRLSNEHFKDARHSHGGENLLRESRGATAIRFLPPHEYHYTVEVVPEGADLVHQACGTGLRLHQHFKDDLTRDPTFYAKVFCPTCKVNAPFAQFSCSMGTG
jgi:hypothetical protein